MEAVFAVFVGTAMLIFGMVLSELAPAELKAVIIVISAATFLVSIIFALYVDYKNGKYKCPNCGEKFVPSAVSYVFSAHFGTTRYLKCPKCNEKSWCKQVKKRDVL